MPSDRFTWLTDRKRYRDEDSGRLITDRRMRRMRDRYIASIKTDARGLADGLDDGSLTVGEWERRMRALVKDAHGAEYVFGRGGRNVMTQRDWGRLGRALRTQYQYLNGFAREIADGTLSAAKIRARAALYIASATQAYERGREQAHPRLRLPAHPADGSTACLANCRCHWQIRETKREYRATWVVNRDAEHCADCLDRAERWAPFVQAKETDDGD